MSKITSPYRYDFVGSFLRPENLKQARKDFKADKLSKEQLTAIEDEAIRDLVAKQKKAGYHIITDGAYSSAESLQHLKIHFSRERSKLFRTHSLNISNS